MTDIPQRLTLLLNEAAQGDGFAAKQVFPQVYAELKKLAASKRNAQAGSANTLHTTALVNEAYLRIVDKHPLGWNGRSHFYFAAARAMRDILVEDARQKASHKRGGGLHKVSLEEVVLTLDAPPDEMLALHEVLARLEEENETGYRLVMLRFFAGLTVSECAQALDTPLSTVERRWRFLRAWLDVELQSRLG